MQRRRQVYSVASVVAAALVAGCGGKEEIRTYRVAGPSDNVGPADAAPATPPAERGDPTDRMLAAVLAGPDRVWFLKAVGQRDLIESRRSATRELFASFDVNADPPTWKLPEGWSEEKGGGMRFATFRSPATPSGDTLEVSVIDLPKTGDWESQLLGNLNRWRGQMGQPPIDADQLAASVEPLNESDSQSVLVDIEGWFSGGMSPTGQSIPQVAANAPAARPAASAPPRDLKYTTPDGWADQPGSAMRKASFKTEAGSEVTAFVFAAGGGMSDPVGNVNRWRGQVGLPPTTKEELDAAAETIEVSGGDAIYVELLGEENGTLAAMSERGPSIWFFKLTGPSDAVDADRQAFADWLASLEF